MSASSLLRLLSMPNPQIVRASRCGECAIRDRCAFGRLDDGHAAFVKAQIHERMFDRGEVLVAEGETPRSLRVVKMGTVFAYRRGLDGRSRPIGVVTRGSAMGTFALFDKPNPASCVALTMVRACEISIDMLGGSRACEQRIVAEASVSIAGHFAAVAAWSEAMRLPGVVNQLAYVAVLLSDAQRTSMVDLPSHAHLSELLGTRRETIARALRTLESEGGILRHERKRCEVFRSRLLSRLAAGGY